MSWNNQQFNQGSPKPDGTSPGNTTPVTGIYDSATGAFTLEWSSQVVGGPFNGFSAYWHLTGTFVPAQGTSPPPATPTGSPSQAPPASGAPSSPGTAAPATSASKSAGSSSPQSSSFAKATTITTTTMPASVPSPSAGTRTRAHVTTVVSSRTITTGGGGWNAPLWLVVAVAIVAMAGLAGLLASERALRRSRTSQAAS